MVKFLADAYTAADFGALRRDGHSVTMLARWAAISLPSDASRFRAKNASPASIAAVMVTPGAGPHAAMVSGAIGRECRRGSFRRGADVMRRIGLTLAHLAGAAVGLASAVRWSDALCSLHTGQDGMAGATIFFMAARRWSVTGAAIYFP